MESQKKVSKGAKSPKVNTPRVSPKKIKKTLKSSGLTVGKSKDEDVLKMTPGTSKTMETTPDTSSKLTVNTDVPGSSGVKQSRMQQKKKKKYYVLFLGNLPYDITEDEVREHFVRCGVIEDVRLLTNKETGRPRGCAYIQFEEMRGHKNALMLHKSMFKGREINVEFTAPGRKNATRTMKLQEKNKRLSKYKLSRDHILERPDDQQRPPGHRPGGENRKKFHENTSCYI